MELIEVIPNKQYIDPLVNAFAVIKCVLLLRLILLSTQFIYLRSQYSACLLNFDSSLVLKLVVYNVT